MDGLGKEGGSVELEKQHTQWAEKGYNRGRVCKNRQHQHT